MATVWDGDMAMEAVVNANIVYVAMSYTVIKEISMANPPSTKDPLLTALSGQRTSLQNP